MFGTLVSCSCGPAADVVRPTTQSHVVLRDATAHRSHENKPNALRGATVSCAHLPALTSSHGKIHTHSVPPESPVPRSLVRNNSGRERAEEWKARAASAPGPSHAAQRHPVFYTYTRWNAHTTSHSAQTQHTTSIATKSAPYTPRHLAVHRFHGSRLRNSSTLACSRIHIT